ncbi:head GIN domain-containing protein [Ferruginibacter sp. HRS2-29]|uniref:head GIN domain-containing protein n=1 Tax=Ferruginibacter sp. HRS2-29 TaxID=2487334 RepID=UPI0020CF2319|nr:head GIN domain-containing protein [Ferruginibacter sp. HRS2-29]MCP9750776.1 DUF2807 domain-containing protein [Ferruginibacter sp. HRS2-29]
MKKLLIIIAAGVLFSSCDSESGSGHVITQKRSATGFTKLSVSSGIEVELRKGPGSVTVEADDNLMEFIETEVENGTLKIGIKDHTSLHDVHIRVFVTANDISSIKASSAASVEVKDPLVSSGTVSLDASSAASITTSVEAPEVHMEASSASEIKVSGRTRNVNANSSSASTIKAFELLSENTVAEASSGSSIDVFASVSIEANASSGSDIDYKGAAAVVKKQESSGGSVSKEN